MAIFPNVYIAMIMISTMGVISMSISYCPYALLGQYHEIKEVRSPASTFVFHFHPEKLKTHLLVAVYVVKSESQQ